MHLLAGPGDAHEHQPPLLLELLRLVQASLVRQNAVLHRDEVDDRKFEPLGGMKCHQGDAFRPGVPGIGVGDEGGRLQEAAQRIDLAAAGPGSRGQRFVVLPGRRHELLDVGQPLEALLVVLRLVLELTTIARLLEHAFEQGRHARLPAGRLAERGVQPGEGRQLPGGLLGHARDAIGRSGRGQPTAAVVFGPGGEPLERLPADAPRRHVHHPEKRLVVAGISQQPQPGHDVADLAALEELQATDELIGHAGGAQRDLERP